MAVRLAWGGIDRDELVAALARHGLEPSVGGKNVEVIEIPCADGDNERVCDEVLAQVESLIGELGLPLVPEKGDGQVFVRPPAA